MATMLHIGTRKGLFTLDAENPRIEAPDFLGDPVVMILHDPRDRSLYAALATGHHGSKFWRKAADSEWVERASPCYPVGMEGGPSVKFVWSLEQGGGDLLWAGTLPGGLFMSSDQGNSWDLVTSLWNDPLRSSWMGGGYPEPGIHSILVDPRDTRHILVGVSVGGLWRSTDQGASWTLEGDGMRADYSLPSQKHDRIVQDPHRIVQSPSNPDRLWIQHHNGVWRSDDAGRTCTEVSPPLSGFGFAVVVDPQDPDTAWFIPAVRDDRRVPVENRLAVVRTRDGGLSFQVLTNGLPKRAYDIVYRHAFDISPKGDILVFGSTTGSLWISMDKGENWTLLTAHLPPINCVRFSAV